CTHERTLDRARRISMKRIAIIYATRHGHTRHIAEHVAEFFQSRGADAQSWSVLDAPGGIDLRKYSAVVIAASVHKGHHEEEMIRYVKAHRTELEAANNAFISVTLSQAGVERADATPAERDKAAADVERMIGDFIAETGWRPQRMLPVAGAL